MSRLLALRSRAVAWTLACVVATAHAASAAHAATPATLRVAAPCPSGASAIAASIEAALERAARDADLQATGVADRETTTHHDPWYPAAFVFQSHSARYLAAASAPHRARPTS